MTAAATLSPLCQHRLAAIPAGLRLLSRRRSQQPRSARPVVVFAAMSTAVASNKAVFAYTVCYVKDVQTSVDFYQKAFGLDVRRVDNSRKWGEMETGATTLCFTPLQQREAKITGGIHAPAEGEQRSNVEVSFSYDDVKQAFDRAVQAGAIPLAEPEPKPWGQTCGYVRDPDGIVIRIGSHVQE
eukprot:SM000052S17697  [mRNA]  locus=s52:153981:155208:- [translate_table: standard]